MKIYAVAIYTAHTGCITLDFFKAKAEFKALVQASNQFFSDNNEAMDDISRLTKKQELIDYFNDCDMEITWKEVKPLKEDKQP